MHETPEVTSVGFADLVRATGGHLDGSGDVVVSAVTLDSRAAEPGTLFAAVPGRRHHGAEFAHEAIALGAVAIMTDARGAELARPLGVPVAVYADVRRSLAEVSRQVYRASDAMTLIGVTGTNGKTSVTFMIAGGLRTSGTPTALLGTLGVNVGESWRPLERTTPEAPELHRIFQECHEAGVTHAVMEVSSIAAVESRVAGVNFAIMVFTNLSQDHLDYHGTMEEYYLAKRSLFDAGVAHQAVVCIDSEWGRRLAADIDIPVITVATEGSDATWTASPAQGWDIRGPGMHAHDDAPTPTFVVANRLCATAALHVAGVPALHAWTAVADISVPGRMELVDDSSGACVWVDYAHTPDAVGRALRAVREQTRGRVITVMGAGGDRDAEKRPHMGAAAAQQSDVLIVTDDNPRSEDPRAIRQAIIDGARGFPGVRLDDIAPREEAIRVAVESMIPGDSVVIVGKGAETYQEISGERRPFDDREIARRVIAEMPR